MSTHENESSENDQPELPNESTGYGDDEGEREDALEADTAE